MSARTYLRREAYPVEWQALSEDQKGAGRSVIDSLHRALPRGLAPRRHSGELEARDSRVLFLSGSRGAGKTTLLVTLRHLFDSAVSRSTESEVDKTLDSLRGHVTWLNAVDMDPLPAGTNLLAAILARIEETIGGCNTGEGTRGAAPARGLLDPLSDNEQLLQRFRGLQNDLVLAWESNLQQRAAGMDLDAYAAEVIRTERGKINVERGLQEALNLMARLSHPYDQQRLFVLPIDDFDVNPDRAVGLLKLIRTLWAPQLFTIFLGDLQLMEHVIYTQTCGKLFHILGTANTSYTRTQQEQLVASANQVAADALRKMIPPSQRLFLNEHRVEDALGFSLGEADAADRRGPPEQTLGQLLKAWPVFPIGLPGKNGVATVIGHKVQNLEDLLLTDIVLGAPLSARSHYLYTGAAILNAPIRYLADTWLLLQKHLPENSPNGADSSAEASYRQRCTEAIVSFSAELLRQAIFEDPRLSFQARQYLLRRFARSTFSEEWELDTEGFTFRARLGSRLELNMSANFNRLPNPTDVKQTAAVFSCKVMARRVRRWSARVRLDHEDTEADWPSGRAGLTDGGDNRLSLRTRAALILYHDLLRFSGLGTVEGSIKDQKIGMRAYTEWSYGVLEPLQVPWFLSVWDTFWEFAIFARVWNEGESLARQIQERHGGSDPARGGRAAQGDNKLTLFLAYTWILGGICVLSPDRPDECLKLFDKLRSDDKTRIAKLQAGELPWENLAASVDALAQELYNDMGSLRNDPRTRKLSTWFTNLALLMMPETGIQWRGTQENQPSRDARELFIGREGPVLKVFLELAQAIRNARLVRLGEFANTFLGVYLVCNEFTRGELRWHEVRKDEIAYLNKVMAEDALHTYEHLWPNPTELLSAMRHFRLKKTNEEKREKNPYVQKYAPSINEDEARELKSQLVGMLKKSWVQPADSKAERSPSK